MNHPMRFCLFSCMALMLACVISVTAQQQSLNKDFLDAVQNRDVSRIETLLKQGADVNAQEHINGHFALQYAINWPDASLVKLLLDKGANVNATDNSGRTALMDAARKS
jgi:ankyrin repeat protein